MPRKAPLKPTRWQIATVLRHPLTWLGLGIVVALLAFVAFNAFKAQGAAPAPNAGAGEADRFMQSVVRRDGDLGWHQLCPALQSQVALPVLAGQVQQQRTAEAGQHLSFTLDYVGAHPRPQGGEIRVYVVVAHRPDGWVAQRTYIITTQADGCVADIATS